jgi:cytochrome c biogenesis protein ResB
MKLKNFSVGRYPGTMMAMSYESVVDVAGQEHVISMNEPLKHAGFTFYQASFQEDESGKPFLSVLSVNYDPGRWIKYLGSIILVLGIILLFYEKNKKRSW